MGRTRTVWAIAEALAIATRATPEAFTQARQPGAPRRARRVRRHRPPRANPPRRALLRRDPPARRPRPRARVAAGADPAHLASEDRPRQGLRPHPFPRGRREGYRAMDERRPTKVLPTL